MSSSSPQPPAPSTVHRSSVTKWIIVFILRIVVLAGFGSGAIALGMIAGHFTPRNNPNPPLFLRLFAPPQPEAIAPKPVLNQTIAKLTPENKAAIQQEIKGISEQLQVLETRTQKLETELDLPPQTGDLSGRLNNLSELLNQNPADVPPPETTSSKPPADTLKITLPSNLLFDKNGQLNAAAEDTLDAIAIDLQENKKKTITIAGHHFSSGKITAEELSFQQAQAVKVYLSKQLSGNYRWIIIGYGASRPLVTDNIQANQRIEITTE